MKRLASLLALLGVLVVFYSIIGRFVGKGPCLGLGLIKIYPSTGVTLANSLMLMAILIKLWGKEKD